MIAASCSRKRGSRGKQKKSAFDLSVLNLGPCRRWKYSPLTTPSSTTPIFTHGIRVLHCILCLQFTIVINTRIRISTTFVWYTKEREKRKSRSGTARIVPLPPVGGVGQSAARDLGRALCCIKQWRRWSRESAARPRVEQKNKKRATRQSTVRCAI